MAADRQRRVVWHFETADGEPRSGLVVTTYPKFPAHTIDATIPVEPVHVVTDGDGRASAELYVTADLHRPEGSDDTPIKYVTEYGGEAAEWVLPHQSGSPPVQDLSDIAWVTIRRHPETLPVPPAPSHALPNGVSEWDFLNWRSARWVPSRVAAVAAEIADYLPDAGTNWYVQDAAPSGAHVGELWLDTDPSGTGFVQIRQLTATGPDVWTVRGEATEVEANPSGSVAGSVSVLRIGDKNWRLPSGYPGIAVVAAALAGAPDGDIAFSVVLNKLVGALRNGVVDGAALADSVKDLLLPDGGSTGQLLAKKSGTDGDTEWKTVDDEGLLSVTTDSTLTGDGTSSDALKVANPFTAAYETKLDGIAAGAEVNVQSDWNESSSTDDAFIKNKPTIPAQRVPDGGSTGQLLAKKSGTDGDTEWKTVDAGDPVIPAWAAGVWTVGELCRHSGNVVYMCIVARTAANTSGPDSDTSSWAAVTSYRGTWVRGWYARGQVVLYSGDFYICNANISNDAANPATNSKWTKFTGVGGSFTGVTTDSTLTGDGTSSDALKVANPFTQTDEDNLDGVVVQAERNEETIEALHQRTGDIEEQSITKTFNKTAVASQGGMEEVTSKPASAGAAASEFGAADGSNTVTVSDAETGTEILFRIPTGNSLTQYLFTNLSAHNWTNLEDVGASGAWHYWYLPIAGQSGASAFDIEMRFSTGVRYRWDGDLTRDAVSAQIAPEQRDIDLLEDLTADIVRGSPSTGWSDTTTASQGGMVLALPDPTTATAASALSGWAQTFEADFGKHLVVRIPTAADAQQYRVEFDSIDPLSPTSYDTLSSYRRLGRSGSWIYYTSPAVAGDQTLTLQATASAAHIGTSKFVGITLPGKLDGVISGARKFLRQDGTWQNPPSGGGGAAPTLANVTSALGLDAVAAANRGKLIQRKNDDSGYQYIDVPSGGGGAGTRTQLLRQALPQATNGTVRRTYNFTVPDLENLEVYELLVVLEGTWAEDSLASIQIGRHGVRMPSDTEDIIVPLDPGIFATISDPRAAAIVSYTHAGAKADVTGEVYVVVISPLAGHPSPADAKLTVYAIRAGGGDFTGVTTDSTLTGDGTSSDALKVANPFTAADETKLDGIAAGAEVNVQSDWSEVNSSSDAFIANKPTIPAAVPASKQVPDGGTTGQSLVKKSGTDGDTEWKTVSGGGAQYIANKTDLAAKLEAIPAGMDFTANAGRDTVDLTLEFDDFTEATTVASTDLLLIENADGLRKVEAQNAIPTDARSRATTLFDANMTFTTNQQFVAATLSADWDSFDAISIVTNRRSDASLATVLTKGQLGELAVKAAGNNWYDGNDQSAYFLIDQGGQGVAVGVSSNKRQLLFAMTTGSNAWTGPFFIEGLVFAGPKGEPGTDGAQGPPGPGGAGVGTYTELLAARGWTTNQSADVTLKDVKQHEVVEVVLYGDSLATGGTYILSIDTPAGFAYIGHSGVTPTFKLTETTVGVFPFIKRAAGTADSVFTVNASAVVGNSARTVAVGEIRTEPAAEPPQLHAGDGIQISNDIVSIKPPPYIGGFWGNAQEGSPDVEVLRLNDLVVEDDRNAMGVEISWPRGWTIRGITPPAQGVGMLDGQKTKLAPVTGSNTPTTQPPAGVGSFTPDSNGTLVWSGNWPSTGIDLVVEVDMSDFQSSDYIDLTAVSNNNALWGSARTPDRGTRFAGSGDQQRHQHTHVYELRPSGSVPNGTQIELHLEAIRPPDRDTNASIGLFRGGQVTVRYAPSSPTVAHQVFSLDTMVRNTSIDAIGSDAYLIPVTYSTDNTSDNHLDVDSGDSVFEFTRDLRNCLFELLSNSATVGSAWQFEVWTFTEGVTDWHKVRDYTIPANAASTSQRPAVHIYFDTSGVLDGQQFALVGRGAGARSKADMGDLTLTLNTNPDTRFPDRQVLANGLITTERIVTPESQRATGQRTWQKPTAAVNTWQAVIVSVEDGNGSQHSASFDVRSWRRLDESKQMNANVYSQPALGANQELSRGSDGRLTYDSGSASVMVVDATLYLER